MTTARASPRSSTKSPLGAALHLQRGIGASKWGFFLRAETMHSWYTFIEQHPSTSAAFPDPEFHELSHGESFLAVLASRFEGGGFYCLDELELVQHWRRFLDAPEAYLRHLRD